MNFINTSWIFWTDSFKPVKIYTSYKYNQTMSKIVMGYMVPGWTPRNLVSYLYQEFLKRGIQVEQTSLASFRLKKGGLILWEGYAEVSAYQRGNYIELLISSSEMRSSFTGGLIGWSKAKKAREIMMNTILSILGQPAYMQKL